MLLAGMNSTAGGPGAEGYLSVIVRALIVMVFIAGLIGFVIILRKRLTEGEAEDATSSFSMGGMRDLVRQGKLTQAEFEQAKAAIVEATQKQIARDAAKKAEAERKAGQIGNRPRQKRAAGVDPLDAPPPAGDVPPSAPN